MVVGHTMILLLVAAALIVSGTVMLRYAKPLAPIFRQWFGQDYEWWLMSYFYHPYRSALGVKNSADQSTKNSYRQRRRFKGAG